MNKVELKKQLRLTRASLCLALLIVLSCLNPINASAVDFSDSQAPVIKSVVVESPRELTRGVPGQYAVTVTMLDDKNESFMQNGGFYFPNGDYLNFVCFGGKNSQTVSRDLSGVTTIQKFVCDWGPYNFKPGVGRIGNFQFQDKAGNKGVNNVVADTTNSLTILEPAITPPQNAPTDLKINWNGVTHFLSWTQNDNPSFLPTLQFQVEWSTDGSNWKSVSASRIEKRSQIDLPKGTTIYARVASNNYFGLSAFAQTGPFKAPESGLFPRFSSISRSSKGFTFQITNYDSQFTWLAESTAGTTSISSSGLVTVMGVDPGKSAVVTVRTQRNGYESAAFSITGNALNDGMVPKFGNPTSTSDSVTIPIINYDASFIWSIKSTSGIASISPSGQVAVRGLSPSSTVNIEVISTREGFEERSATISLSTLTAVIGPTIPSGTETRKVITITCTKAKKTKKISGFNP